MSRLCLLALVALVIACNGSDSKRVAIPGAPETLELIAEEEASEAGQAPARQRGADKASPPATVPLRRGSCGIPLATSLERLMKPDGVERIQKRLIEEGLLAADELRSGDLDEVTLSAVSRFQRRVELPEVGLPTYSTVRALGLRLDEVFVTASRPCREVKQ